MCGWRPLRRFGKGLTLDHIVPRIAHATSHEFTNLITMCKACNDRKGDRSLIEVFGAAVAQRVLLRAARAVRRWHKRRGYWAAIRAGRYNPIKHASKCKAWRKECRYLSEERIAIQSDALSMSR